MVGHANDAIDNVVDVGEIYTLLAMRADHALVLPFDLSGTVDWASASLAADQALAPSESTYFASAATALNDLKEQVTLKNAYAEALMSSYATTTGYERTAIEAEAAALNQKLFEARRIINVWSLGEGGTAGSWDVFLRTHQHAHDLKFLDAALSALQRGRVSNALTALESVYSMEWGHRFGRDTYLNIMDGMMQTDMYWGAEWDQQQQYVDVQGIYLALKDREITTGNARSSPAGACAARTRRKPGLGCARPEARTRQRGSEIATIAPAPG